MKRTQTTALFVLVIVILLAGGGFAYYHKNGGFSLNRVVKDSGDKVSDYSAVFLTNGQVYFGKIMSDRTDVVDLQDIYYLQVDQQIQPENKNTSPSPSPQPNVVLVKLGQELHGPNDRMLINKQQVLFTESLKNDSKVIKAIQDNQKK